MIAKEPNSNGHSPQLLFIDDEKDFQRFIFRHLAPLDYEIVMAEDWEEAKPLLQDRLIRPAIIFVEPHASGGNGVDVLKEIQSEDADAPIVVISTDRDPRAIVEAVKGGAREYLVKPFKLESLQSAIERVLNGNAKQEEEPAVRKTRNFKEPDFVFANSVMKEIEKTVLQIADTAVPVLIHGETGVGKDVVARQIHARSKLKSRNFVKVNCAALPPELTESELFGHTRGAFTGAVIDRSGKFEFAHGGTIFLDEISEFSQAAQAKLLQVLQDGRFNRLGSNEEIEVDVRVIAATNRDLKEAIETKQFRSDLYFRLNVVNIHIPPLRERRDEIEFLCDYLVRKLACQLNLDEVELPNELKATFQTYDWPGNVRELENMIKRFLVLGDARPICDELKARRGRQTQAEVDEIVGEALQDLDRGVSLKKIAKEAASRVERNLIASTLSRTNWNRLQAAKELRVSYKTLLNRIEEYKISP